MTQTRSNHYRAIWRVKCRERLAEHINHALNLQIKPEDVRLTPRDSDPYRWAVLSPAEHFFTKQISKHTTGTYRKIIHDIGVNFEAIAPTESSQSQESDVLDSSGESFTSQIKALTSHTTELEGKLEAAETQLCCMQSELSSTKELLSQTERAKRQLYQAILRLQADRKAKCQTLIELRQRLHSSEKRLLDVRSSLNI